MPELAVDPHSFSPPASQATSTAAAELHQSRSPGFAVVVGAVALLGLLWVALLWRYRFWIATNDHAVFQLALEQMSDGEIPLVGTYSRLNFKHPGPIREWLFFFPYLVSGGRAAALPATTIIFHTLMFGLSIRAGWKWASTRGACTAAVSVAIMYVAFGKQLHVPWNPLLAATALFAGAWGLFMFVRTGRWAQAVLCASAAAQMHVSAAPPALVIISIVIGLSALAKTGRWEWDRGADAPRWVGPTALGAFVVMWSGPLVDALNNGRSNTSALLEASSAGDDQLGLSNALALAGRIVHPGEMLAGTYLRPGSEMVTGTGGAVPLAAWALISLLAIGLALRAGTQHDRATIVVLIALSSTAVVSMSRFVPPLFGYLFASVSAISVIAVAVTVSTIVAAVLDDPAVERFAWFDTSAIVAGGVAVLLVGTALGASELNQIVPQRRAIGINGAVHAVVVPGATYAVRAGGNIGALAESEVALQIELSGGDATSDISSLGLPPEDTGAPLFIAAMAGVRQCLIDFKVGQLILDGSIEAVGQDIAIVFLQPNERSKLALCPPL
ncbi:hypothetical protein [Ilumatobacter sp.]|uniref:hypothetical protein n=1 Tax=Ilumatobacter sp. TaxID=1967498 RepID=UPI0037525500